jgi:hypothetical protein
MSRRDGQQQDWRSSFGVSIGQVNAGLRFGSFGQTLTDVQTDRSSMETR